MPTSIPAWLDTLYISTDTQLDSSDVAIGSVQHNNPVPLAVGTSYTAGADFIMPSNLAGGNYYLLVKTDVSNNIIEFN